MMVQILMLDRETDQLVEGQVFITKGAGGTRTLTTPEATGAIGSAHVREFDAGLEVPARYDGRPVKVIRA